jgi:integrase
MGMDLNSVADQMGHSNTQMLVNRYGHNVRKKSNEVAERLSDALLENGGVNGGVNKKYKPS